MHEKKPVITVLSSRASFFVWRICHFKSCWFRDLKGLEMAKKNIDTTTVGGRIKPLRIIDELSQDELAEMLHLENRTSISSYETNRRNVSGSSAVEIADALSSSTDYLLTDFSIIDPFIEEIIVIAGTIRLDEVKNGSVSIKGSRRNGK